MLRKITLFILFLGFHGPAEGSWNNAVQKAVDEFIQKVIVHKNIGVAVFDWDNTVIKNDIGDAFFFWMVREEKLLAPPNWKQSSSLLSSTTVEALHKKCPLEGRKYIPTKENDCADLLLSIYTNGKLPDSQNSAWVRDINEDTLEPRHAWAIQLCQGYTMKEIKHYAEKVLQEYFAKPVGKKQKLGRYQLSHYIRFNEPVVLLIKELMKNNYPVWISSASAQPLVELLANKIGIDSTHVIGVRSALNQQSHITPDFEGCGEFKGPNQRLINYRQGKRCWINKVIFKIDSGVEQMNKRSPINLAAGDSDTDVYFLKDAHDRNFPFFRWDAVSQG